MNKKINVRLRHDVYAKIKNKNYGQVKKKEQSAATKCLSYIKMSYNYKLLKH